MNPLKKFVFMLAATFAVLSITGCTADEVNWWLNSEKEEKDQVSIEIITAAANEFGVDPALMVRIARCESGFDPIVKNKRSSARGLYQFLDTTWERARTRLYDRGIDPEPYTPFDVVNPVAAARIAANVVSEGGISWWSESKGCWNR